MVAFAKNALGAGAHGSGRNRRGHQDEGGATAFRTGTRQYYGKKCGRLRPAETPAGKAGIVALQQKHSWRICRVSAYAGESRPGTWHKTFANGGETAQRLAGERSSFTRQLHDSISSLPCGSHRAQSKTGFCSVRPSSTMPSSLGRRPDHRGSSISRKSRPRTYERGRLAPPHAAVTA